MCHVYYMFVYLYVYARCTPALPLLAKVVPDSREILEDTATKSKKPGEVKNK